ncbi:MAG TPA: glycosyltransferase family 4 protein [Candidatus Acidoferrum sp.]|nr:glycosyltransferase family 4 protein [Candidatus Acidoferrum sp.]
MHILLLNEYYPPDTSATAKMAAMVVETLATRHRVTVIAGRPSYDPTEKFPWRLLRRASSGNIAIERVGSTAFPRFKMLRRVSNYLTYLVLAIPRAIMIRSDVILAMTDPPIAGIAGAIVSRLTGRPFVYNIRDLYPDMAVGGDIVRPGLAARIWERMHRWALRRAVRVIVLGDDMRDRIIAKGVDAARISVVRDGVTISAELPALGNPVSQEIRSGFQFVALHAGNIGFYGAWDTLLDAARRLGDSTSGIIFVGEGAQKARIVATAGATPAIRFLPFRPAAEIPSVLAAGDVHIITVKRGLEGVIVPSKLYPILAAGKPVLAVSTPKTDVARIITEAGCGVVVDPDDPDAVALAIQDLAAHPERVAEMAHRAAAIARNYDKFAELNCFLKVIEGVIPE